MKLSYRWLDELVGLGGRPPAEVARLLTFHTAPVDSVTEIGTGLDGVVAARVRAVLPHPNADRLRLCTVDPGPEQDVLEVVCGAPNVAEGQMVCFAPVGLTLPNGVTLKKARIRGVESAGMICAEDELGLGEGHEGILVLPEDTPVGTPAAEALGARDSVFEIANPDITHRPDLWGHVGFARELAALLERPFAPPATPRADAALAASTLEPFPVSIEDEDGCRRYVGTVVEDVENGPSPAWLRRRLEALGQRSIDLVVDLTNLVMLEQGQPLHAFDLRDLGAGRIVVRRARAGETMKTLDGVERRFAEDDLLITDGGRALAVAGVMGGEDSEVRADTRAILLEAANFDAVRIRRTASRLGLRTEASSRFEKALDPVSAEAATRRFLELLLAHVPGARVTHRVADAYPGPYPPVTIRLPYDLPARRLGLKLPDVEVRAHLTSLGFGVSEANEDLVVSVPSWRSTKDVRGPEDLVEEVGRVHGYRDVPRTAPVGALTPTRPSPLHRLERRIAATLSLDLGYAEMKAYSFYGERDAERLGLGGVTHLRVRNPLTEDQDRLALTAAASLLGAAQKNAVNVPAARLWESTRLILPVPRDEGLPCEIRVAGLVAWDRELEADPTGTLYRSVLEDVQAVLAAAPVCGAGRREAGSDALAPGLPAPVWLHPGRRALFEVPGGEGDVLALVGEVAPAVMRAYGLSGRAVLGEIAIERVFDALAARGRGYRPLHRFPVVPFDVAVIVARKTLAARVAAVIAGVSEGQVRNVRLFDEYEGAGIPPGHRSLAFTCELLDPKGTLDTPGADRLRRRIRAALEQEGWTVRAGDGGA